MKRYLDIIFSICALMVSGPVILMVALLIWLQDRKWPFYTPWRIGMHGKAFRLFKLRSMIADADKSKVDTTTNNDIRITTLGRWIRRFKIDELPQFLNVLLGQMSLVGPRPNIDREVALYSDEERRMLSVPPGITDLSSIVFSDLGAILAEAEDANLAYNQLVRPWKSRFSLFYIDHNSFRLDVRILLLTVIAIFNPGRAQNEIIRIFEEQGAPSEWIELVRRDKPLVPAAPPGLDDIVTSRRF